MRQFDILGSSELEKQEKLCALLMFAEKIVEAVVTNVKAKEVHACYRRLDKSFQLCWDKAPDGMSMYRMAQYSDSAHFVVKSKTQCVRSLINIAICIADYLKTRCPQSYFDEVESHLSTFLNFFDPGAEHTESQEIGAATFKEILIFLNLETM